MCKNKNAKKTLKPSLPTQAAVISELKILGQKVDSLISTLAEQGHGGRRDLGGWTTIKASGTDVEGNELPWHAPGSQPKTELTNQIWVLPYSIHV